MIDTSSGQTLEAHASSQIARIFVLVYNKIRWLGWLDIFSGGGNLSEKIYTIIFRTTCSRTGSHGDKSSWQMKYGVGVGATTDTSRLTVLLNHVSLLLPLPALVAHYSSPRGVWGGSWSNPNRSQQEAPGPGILLSKLIM